MKIDCRSGYSLRHCAVAVVFYSSRARKDEIIIFVFCFLFSHENNTGCHPLHRCQLQTARSRLLSYIQEADRSRT